MGGGVFFVLIWWIFCCAAPAFGGERLVIPGTGDSQKLLGEIAHAFEKTHPGTTIEIPESIGSTGGIRNVSAGNAVVARVARPLKVSEQEAGLHYLSFAFTPVVFAAHLQECGVKSLDSDQVVGIFSGVVSDWSQLGDCPSRPIYVANREPGDSSRSVIETTLPAFKAISEPVGETVYTTPDTVRILKTYANTIAYVPLAELRDADLAVMAFEGISPTPENIREGRYPLVVPLGMVWKGELPPLASQFIAYLFSPEGQSLILDSGLVPAASPPPGSFGSSSN